MGEFAGLLALVLLAVAFLGGVDTVLAQQLLIGVAMVFAVLGVFVKVAALVRLVKQIRDDVSQMRHKS